MKAKNKTVAERIKQCRENKEWTQLYTANLLGISHANFSKIETGKIAISIRRLNQLADIFNVPVNILLNGETENTYENDIAVLEKRLEEQDKRISAIRTKLIALYEEVRECRRPTNHLMTIHR